jgi:hypothetical protein
MIMFWQENVLEKDTPPRWMWSLDEELSDHFERVKAKRDGGDDDDDRDDGPGPMLQNEYAKNRGRNAR